MRKAADEEDPRSALSRIARMPRCVASNATCSEGLWHLSYLIIKRQVAGHGGKRGAHHRWL